MKKRYVSFFIYLLFRAWKPSASDLLADKHRIRRSSRLEQILQLCLSHELLHIGSNLLTGLITWVSVVSHAGKHNFKRRKENCRRIQVSFDQFSCGPSLAPKGQCT